MVLVVGSVVAGLRGGGATILVVAYLRATIALADQRIYLEQGRVVATGSHTQRECATARAVQGFDRGPGDPDPASAGLSGTV